MITSAIRLALFLDLIIVRVFRASTEEPQPDQYVLLMSLEPLQRLLWHPFIKTLLDIDESSLSILTVINNTC